MRFHDSFHFSCCLFTCQSYVFDFFFFIFIFSLFFLFCSLFFRRYQVLWIPIEWSQTQREKWPDIKNLLSSLWSNQSGCIQVCVIFAFTIQAQRIDEKIGENWTDLYHVKSNQIIGANRYARHKCANIWFFENSLEIHFNKWILLRMHCILKCANKYLYTFFIQFSTSIYFSNSTQWVWVWIFLLQSLQFVSIVTFEIRKTSHTPNEQYSCAKKSNRFAFSTYFHIEM